MMDAVTEARIAFTGAYGYFCALAARAVHYGVVTVSEVQAAMGGHGDDWRTKGIRTARAKANEALVRCKKAGAPDDLIHEEALAVRLAVEGEWDVTLPLVRS